MGVAAFASALLGMAALALSASALRPSPHDEVDEALLFHKHAGEAIGASVLQAISIALLTPILLYLYRATRYRRPEIPRPAFQLTIAAPVIVGAFTVVRQIQVISASNDVVKRFPLPGGKAGRDFARDKITGGSAPTIGGIALAAGVALAIAVGLIAINARRAGLLSNFMGILGVIVGVLLVLPILGPPVVQYFWVVALGLLFIDRWPGQGRGPAWEEGEAIPWPTAAELRAEQQEAAGDGGDGRRSDRGAMRRLEQRAQRGLPDEEAEEEKEEVYEDEPEPADTPHPRSKKRKRKRRR